MAADRQSARALSRPHIGRTGPESSANLEKLTLAAEKRLSRFAFSWHSFCSLFSFREKDSQFADPFRATLATSRGRSLSCSFSIDLPLAARWALPEAGMV